MQRLRHPRCRSIPVIFTWLELTPEGAGIVVLVSLLVFTLSTCQAGRTDLVKCWQNKTPSSPTFTPTIFKHCLDAIEHSMIVNAKLALVPQHFSRTPGRGFTVPHSWISGNCVIGIDTHSPDDGDTFRLYDIAVQASLVNLGCVAPAPHFGGTVKVGPRQVLNVSILGYPFPDAENFKLDGGPKSIRIAGH